MHCCKSIRTSAIRWRLPCSTCNLMLCMSITSCYALRARWAMPDDITKGELVRVIVPGLFKGQECQVLAVEHNTEHHHWFARTWYLLDTRYSGHSWSQPRWVERHEIERVTPEDRGVVE